MLNTDLEKNFIKIRKMGEQSGSRFCYIYIYLVYRLNFVVFLFAILINKKYSTKN